MTDQHPITPPIELVRDWAQIDGEKDLERFWLRLATQAARWGADQELEACCKLNVDTYKLRTFRRPKAPSLKGKALEALDSACYQPGSEFKQIDPSRLDTIRRALEQLND